MTAMPKLENPTPKTLRLLMTDASWREHAKITVTVGRERFDVTVASVDDHVHNSYGPDQHGGITLELDEAKFQEVVRAHARAKLANLIQ